MLLESIFLVCFEYRDAFLSGTLSINNNQTWRRMFSGRKTSSVQSFQQWFNDKQVPPRARPCVFVYFSVGLKSTPMAFWGQRAGRLSARLTITETHFALSFCPHSSCEVNQIRAVYFRAPGGVSLGWWGMKVGHRSRTQRRHRSPRLRLLWG